MFAKATQKLQSKFQRSWFERHRTLHWIHKNMCVSSLQVHRQGFELFFVCLGHHVVRMSVLRQPSMQWQFCQLAIVRCIWKDMIWHIILLSCCHWSFCHLLLVYANKSISHNKSAWLLDPSSEQDGEALRMQFNMVGQRAVNTGPWRGKLGVRF